MKRADWDEALVDWKDQWDRMERYFDRIHKAKFGLLPRESLHTPEQREQVHDDIFTYFVHAHHLREWLASHGVDVTAAARASRILAVCADIANSAKHVTLRQPKVGQPTKEGPVFALILNQDGKSYEIGVDLYLSIDGRQFSGYEFASRVRAEWIQLIAEQDPTFSPREFVRPPLRTLRPVGPDPHIVSVRLHDVP